MNANEIRAYLGSMVELCRNSQNPFCGTNWVRVRNTSPLPTTRGRVGEIRWMAAVVEPRDETQWTMAWYLEFPGLGFGYVPQRDCDPVFDPDEIVMGMRPPAKAVQAALL